MTMAEKRMNSIQKEIEKLEKSLDRYKGLLAKKVIKCEKLNCNWTREQMFEKRNNGEMSQEQWSAWFDKSLKEGDVEDTQKRLENAGKRFEKAVAEYERSSENSKSCIFLNNRSRLTSVEFLRSALVISYSAHLRSFGSP